MLVYAVIAGWNYEGSYVQKVFGKEEDAIAYLKELEAEDYGDYRKIMVYVVE